MPDLGREPGACNVCERSMLAGERTRTYFTRDREQREVCELCIVRAESAGWVSSEHAGSMAPERREGGGAMRRLFGRTREGRGSRAPIGSSSEPPAREGRARSVDSTEADEPARRPPRRSEPPAQKVAEEESPPKPTAQAESARPRSVPQNPEGRIRKAFESFNASEHRQTVRRLIRSLGGPYVAAVTTDEAPGDVRITIAWELSWYQYEVDLTAAGQPVRELGRGEELTQLPEVDQGWNAHAAEDGELRGGLIGSES